MQAKQEKLAQRARRDQEARRQAQAEEQGAIQLHLLVSP